MKWFVSGKEPLEDWNILLKEGLNGKRFLENLLLKIESDKSDFFVTAIKNLFSIIRSVLISQIDSIFFLEEKY